MRQVLNCPNCGAPASNVSKKLGIVVCDYCETTFTLPQWFVQPEPDMGDVFLRADFSHKDLPGWKIQSEENVEVLSSPEPALCAAFDPSQSVHYVLRSNGWYDDVDASVSLRFVKGDVQTGRAALFLRYRNGVGGYGFFISLQSTYMFGYYEKNEKGNLDWHSIMDWTEHSALHPGHEATNRLRVIARGDKFKVYMNGVLAASFTHPLHAYGQVRLAVEPGSKAPAEVNFYDVQVREVPDEE